jgi:cytidylate kinase
MIIAVDGPAGAGKGTLSKRLAKHFNFAYLETGLLYRAIGLKMLEESYDPTNAQEAERIAKKIQFEDLNNKHLRGDKVASAASKVSAHKEVRSALLKGQRDFAAHPPKGLNGAVLDGRDIGTSICPDTPFKIYVTANLELRAQRRLKELQKHGIESIYNAVLEDMLQRDKRDKARINSPLRPADDAYIIDTSDLSRDKVFQYVLNYVLKRQLGLLDISHVGN